MANRSGTHEQTKRADLEVDFAVTTTLAFTLRQDTREVAHNLGRAPKGWYVVDINGLGLVWRVPLTGKSTGQDKKLIAFKVAAETDLKVKIKVF